MRRYSRFFRRGWVLAAFFQLLLPTFASVADALAEAESLRTGAATHIEDYGRRGCPRVHPVDCVLCRVLATGASPASAPTLHVFAARVIENGLAESCRPVVLEQRAGEPASRAPPI